jgi:regulatory protein YycI of two-component signal transduction system YycFG
MSIENRKEIKDLKDEIIALKSEIKSLKRILVPEISISDEEKQELHEILDDMHKGHEYSFKSILKEERGT